MKLKQMSDWLGGNKGVFSLGWMYVWKIDLGGGNFSFFLFPLNGYEWRGFLDS